MKGGQAWFMWITVGSMDFFLLATDNDGVGLDLHRPSCSANVPFVEATSPSQ